MTTSYDQFKETLSRVSPLVAAVREEGGRMPGEPDEFEHVSAQMRRMQADQMRAVAIRQQQAAAEAELAEAQARTAEAELKSDVMRQRRTQVATEGSQASNQGTADVVSSVMDWMKADLAAARDRAQESETRYREELEKSIAVLQQPREAIDPVTALDQQVDSVLSIMDRVEKLRPTPLMRESGDVADSIQFLRIQKEHEIEMAKLRLAEDKQKAELKLRDDGYRLDSQKSTVMADALEKYGPLVVAALTQGVSNFVGGGGLAALGGGGGTQAPSRSNGHQADVEGSYQVACPQCGTMNAVTKGSPDMVCSDCTTLANLTW